MPLVTSDDWKVSASGKATAEFDSDAVRNLKLDISDFLSAVDADYDSHTVTAVSPLEVVQSTFVPGEDNREGAIVALVRVQPSLRPDVKAGKVYGVNFHFRAGVEEDEKTLYLKLKDK